MKLRNFFGYDVYVCGLVFGLIGVNDGIFIIVKIDSGDVIY